MKKSIIIFLCLMAMYFGTSTARDAAQNSDALSGRRFRVLICSDIGGSDPDDFQSMIHFFLYSDLFDTEGIIASPWGKGRKEHILEVIDAYEKDYPKLKSYADYPMPDELRSISKQGAIDRAPGKGYRLPTEGSEWIIKCAHRQDERPLYVLVWGLLEDVAQALHDDPAIQEKIRVYFIGGPNKKWSADAYNYIEENFPNLWMIESNSTYRGWFVGGDMKYGIDNHGFYENYIKSHGVLGDYFGNFYAGDIKMGDTPSVGYLLYGDPNDPEQTGWGGRYRPVSIRPKTVFQGHTSLADKVEVFGIMEQVLNGPDIGPANDTAQFSLIIDRQEFEGYYYGNGVYKLRFSPKAVKEWSYTTKSSIPELDGKTGQFTSVPENTLVPLPDAVKHGKWWTDILDPEFKEGPHFGAKTVNAFRRRFMMDFAQRMDLCIAPKTSDRQVSWRQVMEQPDEWYGSAEAIRIADNVLLYQRDIGGWPKNKNMAALLTDAEIDHLTAEKKNGVGATIDNGATHTQLRYLAKVYKASNLDRFKMSFLSGLDYLLEAQYPNGGWPQFYPIREGYYQHITFNDDAMIGVMKLFRDIAQQGPEYMFVDDIYRQKIKAANDKGLEVILKSQIRVNGKRTAWCAQHDEKTLEAAKARSYELPSLSGMESVTILEYLMDIENPTPEIKTAIIAGCEWYENAKITGQRLLRKENPEYERGYDQVLEPDPTAPPLWARFYGIKTNEPIFPTRDGKPNKNLSDLTYERRNGYRYLGYFADELLKTDFPAWKKKWM